MNIKNCSMNSVVFLDIRKVFDTINHQILIKKLSQYGIQDDELNFFESYLENRTQCCSVNGKLSDRQKIEYGIPQGSIFGPLLFIIYMNDLPLFVTNSQISMYADDTSLYNNIKSVSEIKDNLIPAFLKTCDWLRSNRLSLSIYTGKDIQKIEEQLNSDFTSLCEWFIDNKLSVHFGEEKTKSILFGTKRQLKDQRDLNLKYGDIEIKQHSRVTYLGCILDNILSGEHMAAKVLNTVHNRLKFLYRKQKFLSLSLRRLLCNTLIQPHFDYACAAWYPLLNKRQSKRIQIAQNKCIRYCLKLDNKAHVGTNEFLKINWLPTKKRVEQCICVNVFKFFNQMSPQYTAEIFHPSSSVHNTRRATQKLDLPFRKSCIGQKTLSYIGPKTWNNLPAQIKLSKSVNTFKHDIKKSFFDDLQKQNDDIFFYY